MNKNRIFLIAMIVVSLLLFLFRMTGVTPHIIISVLGLYMLGVTLAGAKANDKPKVVSEAPVAPSQTDTLETIRKFKELLDAGAITQEEFDAKKKELI